MSDTPNPQPVPPKNPAPSKAAVTHTYEEDLARAMDITDATFIQNMIGEARAKEAYQKDEVVRLKQKSTYTFWGVLFILFALVALVYGVYHFTRLTVPAAKELSIGVFPESAPIPISNLSIRTLPDLYEQIAQTDTNRPVLLQLVESETNSVPLSKEALMSFFEARASEPFLEVFSAMRLGVSLVDDVPVPFIIAGTPTPELATKELLIAEPALLGMFYQPLHIPIAEFIETTTPSFAQSYTYNIPVRTLSLPKKNGGEGLVLYYGYITERVVIISTDLRVIRTVYDTIISQQL